MKARVFTLRLDAEHRALDDSELSAFLEEHDALSVAHHPLAIDGQPALAVIVTWRGRASAPLPAPPRGRPLPQAPPLEVAEPDRALFELLRAWRNERARRDGRPAYVMFTNAQLAEVARVRPATLARLGEVPGIGDSRLAAFGEEVLAVLRSAPEASPPPPAEEPALG